jgi:hypothetical protein
MWFIKLLTLILKLNNFVFNGNNYLQTCGGAMGTILCQHYGLCLTAPGKSWSIFAKLKIATKPKIK